MGLLRALFKRLLGDVVAPEELEGIRLDLGGPHWEIVCPKGGFTEVFRALRNLLPESAVLYFEGGPYARALMHFLHANSISEQVHVAVGTIWPRPTVYHVPATARNLGTLAEIAQHCAEPEVAIHFHAYSQGDILLQWYDAFADPICLSGNIPEDRVRAFAGALSVTYQYVAVKSGR